MSDFTNIINKAAKTKYVKILRIKEPRPGMAGSVVVASAEQAESLAIVLAASDIPAQYSSYRGTDFVFVG